MTKAEILLLVSVRQAIDAVHRALGAPGDHGYSTPAGAALFELYKQRAALADALEEAGRKESGDFSGAVSPYQPTPKGKAERAHRAGKPPKIIIAPGYARAAAPEHGEPGLIANIVGSDSASAVDQVAEVQVVRVAPPAQAEPDDWPQFSLPQSWMPRPSLWKRLRTWFRKARKGGAA